MNRVHVHTDDDGHGKWQGSGKIERWSEWWEGGGIKVGGRREVGKRRSWLAVWLVVDRPACALRGCRFESQWGRTPIGVAATAPTFCSFLQHIHKVIYLFAAHVLNTANDLIWLIGCSPITIFKFIFVYQMKFPFFERKLYNSPYSFLDCSPYAIVRRKVNLLTSTYVSRLFSKVNVFCTRQSSRLKSKTQRTLLLRDRFEYDLVLNTFSSSITWLA